MHEAKFSIEVLGDRYFEGYTQGETWNGWDYPYFSFEQAQQVVDAFNSSHRNEGDGVEARYDAEQDAFYFYFESSGESENFSAVEIEGQKFYPIGSGAWIWESADRWEKQSQTGNVT